MLSYLGDGKNTKDEGKIVILAHDREFDKGNNLDLISAFDKFIKMAKKAGYVFRKLSDYPDDY